MQPAAPESSILILNGPNLNLLGRRDPGVYGHMSFEEFLQRLQAEFPQVAFDYLQSNHEGDLIDALHREGFSVGGIIFNPGAYTHTSIALRDAVEAITTPVVEVHITDIYAREPFRRQSYLREVCEKSIIGKGLDGYREAVLFLIDHIRK